MEKRIKWGIIGAGSIARQFAESLEQSDTGRFYGVASRTESSARKLSEALGEVAVVYADGDALLADDAVEAVYIATPHTSHVSWGLKAIQAGKAVLCEKPMGIYHGEMMALCEAARVSDVLLMEGYMYRAHPQTQRLVELVVAGAIGDLQVVDAAFSYRTALDIDGRHFSQEAGGGGILDVGGYPMSLARLLAGAAQGKAFAEPLSVSGSGVLTESTGVDAFTVATAKFPGGVLASMLTGVRLSGRTDVVLYGSQGQIRVQQPWRCQGLSAGAVDIEIRRAGHDPEIETIDCDRSIFAYEADAFGRAFLAGEKEVPIMSVADSLGNIAAMDQWRKSIGLIYDKEKAPPVIGSSILKRQQSIEMTYGCIPGLDKELSKLVIGADNQTSLTHAAVMFDDFFQRGGNVFDTGFIYGQGLMETIFGQWLALRGIREDIVLIGKGAHTPLCYPEIISVQLDTSLRRLQTDYVDIYMMHRDNPNVPVSAFVDALNEEVRRGRIRMFGGSNWSTERLAEANAYAAANGLQEFQCLSNNFSLARMNDPVWAGCVSASTEEQRTWLEENQLALFPWSSQARGFFTDRAGEDKLDDEEMVRVWYSAENFERRRRALQLAEQKGVNPINIALAYVLHQKFPTFALIGPRTLKETATSMPGLNVSLSDQEVHWLDLRE